MTARGRGQGGAPSATSREDGATRATLNYALGNLGGRQKSWMTSLPAQPQPISLSNPVRNPPVRKTSRPSTHAEAQTQLRQASLTEPIHGQPLSSSTSPQLANVLTHPSSGRHLPSTDAVLPSPSPSEDASLDNIASPTSGAPGTLRNPSPRNVPGDGALQAAAAPKRPLASTDRATPSKKRTHHSTGFHPRPTPPLLDMQNTGVIHWKRTQPMSEERTQSASLNLDCQDGTTQPPFQQHLAPQSIPDERRISLQGGPSLPQVQGPSRPSRPADPPQPLSLLDQATAPNSSSAPTWPAQFNNIRAICMQQLVSIKITYGLNDRSTLDALRIETLEMAIADSDWDYLLTHLFYCLLSLVPQLLPEPVRNNPNGPATVAFLAEVLDANTKLMDDVKRFLVAFPMSIQQLQECSSDQMNKDLVRFIFLMNRAESYQTLKQKCDERGAPPSMYEMVYDLGIASRQLQQMIFKANIRRLWRVWGLERSDYNFRDSFENCALQVLFPMQNDFFNRLRQGRQQEQFLQRERKTELRNLISQFRTLRERYTVQLHQALQSMQMAAQRPVLGNQTSFGPPPHPQYLMGNAFGQTLLDGSNQSSITHQQVFPNLMVSQGRNSQVLLPQPLVPSNSPVNSTQSTVQRGRGRPRGGSRPATYVTRPRLQLQMQHHAEPRMQPNALLHQPPQVQIRPQQYPQPQPQPQLQSRSPLRPQFHRQAPHLPQSMSTPKSMFPPRHFLAQHQRVPNPARFGVHQAHLRDAHLKHEAGVPLYLYVQSFLREPRRLTNTGHKIERWNFTITPEQFERIPQDIPGSTGSPPSRIVDERSILLRLRCAHWTPVKSPDEHAWATSKTSWIPYSFFSLNGKNLELRRKLHYGNDLPIDLTHMVREGDNVLDISVLRISKDNQYCQYLLAIEILGVQTHDTLLKNILANNRISAATTKQRLKEKLLPTMEDEDDDVTLLNKTLTVQLTDPFLGANMPVTPARSKACDHFQCFELSTFLETRNKDGDCTVADHWKCPICSGDARPQHLIVDGFIEDVRDKLSTQGLQNTRAIVVEEDGTWKPEVETLEGVADHDDDDDAPADLGARGKRPVAQVVDIIDLGDSDDG